MQKLSTLLLIILAIAGKLPAATTPLPPMNLTGLNGQPVVTNDLKRDGQWLIVYVRPNCRACDTALRLIQPASVSRTLILGSMSLTELKKIAADYPALAGATWVADTGSQAAGLLHLAGAPVALGVRQQTVQWTINGLLPDLDQYVGLLKAWTK